MRRTIVILFCVIQITCLLVGPSGADDPKCEHEHAGGDRKFPDHFAFGVSTAAYQIEGAWNEDGKGPSIWDTFTHDFPDLIADKSNGDVGPDSYHKFDDDLEALKMLKVQYYRFSISWPRILPNGDRASLNEKGIAYYNMVIDKLLANNIKPMVTMLHYDLPEELSKIGGYTNPLFIEYFDQYADVLYHHFGDRVKHWITFNEPFIYCNLGYGNDAYPPKVLSPGVGDYMCMDHTLKAHATAYHRYKNLYHRDQNGKVGISFSTGFHFSKTNDMNVVDRTMQYNLGWLGYPIFGPEGQYPAVMLNDVYRNSMKEGRFWTRMKPLDAKWSALVKGSADFIGINYYAATYVQMEDLWWARYPSWERDMSVGFSNDPNWRRAKSDWLYCVPHGLEGLLKWIRDNYNNVEVIITENGWSDDGELEDKWRIDYLKAHLQAILNAINDGCNVSTYVHWSLLDNFEWLKGYTEKFGLFRVDVNSTNKERVPKESAHYYAKVIETRMIPENAVGDFGTRLTPNLFQFMFYNVIVLFLLYLLK